MNSKQPLQGQPEKKRLRIFQYALFLLIAFLLQANFFGSMQEHPLNATEINNLLIFFLATQMLAFLAFQAPYDAYILGTFLLVTSLVALSHFQIHPAALTDRAELTTLLRFVLSNAGFLAISLFVFRSRDENTRLRASSEARSELTTTDRVTQLKNRAAFEDELDRELYRIKRYGLQSTLLLVKISDLEKIEKDHGEGLVHKLLLAMAQTVKGILREGDFLARFHADQFAIILPETYPDAAEKISDRIRDNVTKMEIPPVNYPAIRMRVIRLSELMENEDVLDIMEGRVEQKEDSWTEPDLEASP